MCMPCVLLRSIFFVTMYSVVRMYWAALSKTLVHMIVFVCTFTCSGWNIVLPFVIVFM